MKVIDDDDDERKKRRLSQMIDQVKTINSVQKSSKTELSSTLFGLFKVLAIEHRNVRRNVLHEETTACGKKKWENVLVVGHDFWTIFLS